MTTKFAAGVLASWLAAACWASPPSATETAVAPVLKPFAYGAARIDHGPLREQFDRAVQDYLRIRDDDLLIGFRKRAGRPAPGNELGGWYSEDRFNIFGQVLSGLARTYAAGGDPACREKARDLMKGWAQCVEPDGYFFYSRSPNAPHYVYDKMVGALVDMLLYCDAPEAAQHLARITDWAVKNLDRSYPLTRPQVYHKTEWYTLSENLYRAWRATGDARYRDFAAQWHYPEFWDRFADRSDLFAPDAQGRPITGYHGYSHVNTLGGAAQAYLAGGGRKYLDAIVNAAQILQERHCYATGGFGPDERLLPDGQAAERLLSSRNSFETQCGTFAVFKLCRYLSTLTGDAKYGDWVERLAFSAVAATIPMSPDGRVLYYSDYNPLGASKHNHPQGWACCAGTRPILLADLQDLIYFAGRPGGSTAGSPAASPAETARDLYVNLFVPSTLTWERGTGEAATVVKLRQRTRFPEEDQTELDLEPNCPADFAVRLRVPAWLAGPMRCRVNGREVDAPTDEHGWAVVRRTWRSGDRLTVSLPATLRPEPVRGGTPWAIVRGPVVLAVSAAEKNQNPAELLRRADLPGALAPDPRQPLTFHGPAGLLARPFYSYAQGQPYRLYLDPNAHSADEAHFTPGWKSAPVGGQHSSAEPGATAEFTFTGTGVRWVGRRFDDAGVAQVSIDGRPLATVDQFGPGRGQTPFQWEHGGLTRGEHRLSIRVTGQRPQASRGAFVNVAAFEVTP